MALRGSDAVPDSHPTGGTHSRRKFSSILAPGDDRAFTVLPPKIQRKLVFTQKNGGAARVYEEVTGEQLSALAAKLAVDETPYTDFSVWGPHGKRPSRQPAGVHRLSLEEYSPPSQPWPRVDSKNGGSLGEFSVQGCSS